MPEGIKLAIHFITGVRHSPLYYILLLNGPYSKGQHLHKMFVKFLCHINYLRLLFMAKGCSVIKVCWIVMWWHCLRILICFEIIRFTSQYCSPCVMQLNSLFDRYFGSVILFVRKWLWNKQVQYTDGAYEFIYIYAIWSTVHSVVQ